MNPNDTTKAQQSSDTQNGVISWKKNTQKTSTARDNSHTTAQTQKNPADTEINKLQDEIDALLQGRNTQKKVSQSPSLKKGVSSQPKEDGELKKIQEDIEKLLSEFDKETEKKDSQKMQGHLSSPQEAALQSIEARKQQENVSKESDDVPAEKKEDVDMMIQSLKKEIHATVEKKPEELQAKGVQHTYYEDLSSAMGAHDPKTMSELLQKAKFEKKAQQILSAKSKRNILYILGTVLLLGGLLWIASLFIHKKEVTYIREKTVPSLVRADSNIGINLDAVPPKKAKQLIKKVLEEKIPEKSVRNIYYAGKDPLGNLRRLGVKEVFDKLEVQTPQLVYESVEKDFMHGVYRSEKNHPFLILKVLSYDRAFEGMKEWEPHIIDDLGIFLNLPEKAYDRSLLEPGFSDDIIENKNVRVVRFLPREVDQKGEVEDIYPETKHSKQEEPLGEKTISFLQTIKNSFMQKVFAQSPNNNSPSKGSIICHAFEWECYDAYGNQTSYNPNDSSLFCTKKIDYTTRYGSEVTDGNGNPIGNYVCTKSVGGDTFVQDKIDGALLFCYPAIYECHDQDGIIIPYPSKADIENKMNVCIKKANYEAPPVIDETGDLYYDENFVCINNAGGGVMQETYYEDIAGGGEGDIVIENDIWDTLLGTIHDKAFVGMQCDVTGLFCQFNDDISITVTQDFLKASGLMDPASPTGQLDVLTQQILKDFQTINGLKPTGIIDPQTASLISAIVQGLAGDNTLYGGTGVAAINNYIDGTQIGLSAYNDQVQALQIFLYAEGYPITEINGFFDKDTCNALRTYQEEQGLQLADEERCLMDDETLELINDTIREKNYLGSGFTLKDGKLIGTGALEGKFGPGIIGETAYADEFKKGDIVLIYTFLDEHTLLITSHPSVIKEVIRRKALGQLFKKPTNSQTSA